MPTFGHNYFNIPMLSQFNYIYHFTLGYNFSKNFRLQTYGLEASPFTRRSGSPATMMAVRRWMGDSKQVKKKWRKEKLIRKIIRWRNTFLPSSCDIFFSSIRHNEMLYSSKECCNLNTWRWIRWWKVQIWKTSSSRFRTKIYEILLFVTLMTLFPSVNLILKP